MEGSASWLTLGVMLGGALLCFLGLRWSLRLGPFARLHDVPVPCPNTGETYRCELIEDTGRHVLEDVVTCDHYVKPRNLACDKQCLVQLRKSRRAHAHA